MGFAALYPSYEMWPTAKHGVRCGFRSTASTAHEPVPHQVHRAVDRRRGRARPRAQTLAQRLGPDDPGGGGGRRRGDLLGRCARGGRLRSEEHTSELQSLMRISYAVFCLKKKKT